MVAQGSSLHTERTFPFSLWKLTASIPIHKNGLLITLPPFVRSLFFIFVCLNLVLPEPLRAQNNPGMITGTITDADTGLPIAGAHAFIGSTLIGTVSDQNGHFELSRIPVGSHDLWVSMIGYEPMSESFTMNDSTRAAGLHFDLIMQTTVLQVGELTVTARRDRRWKKRLETYKKLFLGETPFAREAVILNSEVLDFDSNWLGNFQAWANEPLKIDNQALGYHVTYVLKEFKREGTTIRYDGDPLYEEMYATNEKEKNQWVQNRELAFHGSFHHFLLALKQGNTRDENFEVMHLPSIEDIPYNNRRFSIDPAKVIFPGEKEGEHMLSFTGVLEITYMEEKESHHYLRWSGKSPHSRPGFQRSWIRLTDGPTAIDANGEVIDPYGVTVYGYFAYERIADELPKEYRPQNSTFNSP